MGEQCQMRTRSWNRMPTKRCSANGIMEEFIVVDDDEVIILDFPESSKCKVPGPSRTSNKSIMQTVISIDDDEEDDTVVDDETDNVHKAESNSTRNFIATNLQTPAELDSEDCQFIQEKCAAFRFSKCKQTFSTMPSSGIRFGLGSDTDSNNSESDCSDCEILEMSHREVREQWEQAALLRKMKKADKAGLKEEAGPSNIHCDINHGPGFECRTEQHDQTSFFCAARNPDCGKETSSTFVETDSRIPDMENFYCSNMEQNNRAKNCANSRFCSKENFPKPSPLSPEIHVEHERFDASTQFSLSEELMHQTRFEKVVEQPNRVRAQCETSQLPHGNKKKKAAYEFFAKEFEEEEEFSKSFFNGNGVPMPVLDSNRAKHRHLDESREQIIDPITSTSGEVQGNNGAVPTVNVMLNREMLKETDEYKRVQEKEWESRQQQLQIQAEEAQRQRKRRKLANTRQLEMERRQKERVEEVRETQKKDEESMNMKEKVRAEITKSLKQVELTSFNMASLLRGLGIHVGGGMYPPPQEVHAAYKRAVLKFHPDRASRGDIKQQVEAEEKFKLIARMKDKFSSVSFR